MIWYETFRRFLVHALGIRSVGKGRNGPNVGTYFDVHFQDRHSFTVLGRLSPTTVFLVFVFSFFCFLLSEMNRPVCGNEDKCPRQTLGDYCIPLLRCFLRWPATTGAIFEKLEVFVSDKQTSAAFPRKISA